MPESRDLNQSSKELSQSVRDLNQSGLMYSVPVSYSGPKWPDGSFPTLQEGGRGTPQLNGGSPFTTPPPSPHAVPECSTQKVVIVMVGLPGRGKTYIAHKVCRYMNWLGIDSKCFLVSDYLREHFQDAVSGVQKFLADYYDPENEDGMTERVGALNLALEDTRTFLNGGGKVAIIDGQAAQLRIRNEIKKWASDIEPAPCLYFLEVSMSSTAATELFKLKHTALQQQDPASSIRCEYCSLPFQEALDDFRQRVDLFRKNYIPVTEEVAYIRLNENGMETKSIRGFLESRIANWVINLSPSSRLKHPIYFARHGQSEYNLQNRIGGNPSLTARGKEDATLICDYVRSLNYDKSELIVLTSNLKRAYQTVESLHLEGYNVVRSASLNEIHGGVCENLSYEEVKRLHPYVEKWRKQSKFTFRYPEGESYQDVVMRLEPILMQLEFSDHPILVVSHQAILRTLFAFFDDKAADTSANLHIPQATIWKYTPGPSGVSRLSCTPLRSDELPTEEPHHMS